MNAQQMIGTHPDVKGNINRELIACIEDCYTCAQTCISCADACLAEHSIDELKQCIRLNQDCADVCAATGALASRRTGSNEQLLSRMLETCMTACRLCGDECQQHASQHAHCRICADTCHHCENSCRQAMQNVGGLTH